MRQRPIIALTTDYGVSSPYVAQLKAVVLAALRDACLVDVSHAVPAQAVRQGELVLRGAAFAFPVGTVHVAVVDPGVGTARRAIAVQARGLSFVGPDNGLLGVALAQPGARAVVLDRPELFLHPVSATFHGRDVFAPVAAELAAGLALTDVGTPIEDAVPSSLPRCVASGERLRGEVLGADAFGNLLTNIPGRLAHSGEEVLVGGRAARRVRTYSDGSPGELLALTGSDGFLEIACREGSAAAALAAAPGLEVVCHAA